MFIVKIGAFYLTADNTMSTNQRDAKRFDTTDDADAAVAALRIRRVKLRARV